VKIGVLTFHRCINYGSYWQARCLAQGLRANGHDAVLLDHDSRRINLAEWKCAFRPTLPEQVSLADRARYREKIQRFFRAFHTMPLSPRFQLEEPSDMPSFDLVIVGSDEVWNLSHPWYGGCRLFYGEEIRAPRLVAYAASFGNYDAQYGLSPEWSQKLKRFERIAVRDEVSRAIVENATGICPALVLDPCLQFPPKPEAAVDDLPQQPYLAVYGHGFSPTFAEHIRRWARHKRLPIVSIGYRNDWADHQWIAAGPHEFAYFISGAEAVATNFFHGCVFALLNRKPFASEISWYRGNKLRCLMALVGGEQHLLAQEAPAAAYDALLDAPLAPAIADRVERLRAASSRYLEEALA
jgi:hypothetical protein